MTNDLDCTTCSACGESVPCSFGLQNQPDNGWTLPFETFGHYSGFDDNIDVLFGKRNSRLWILCHDCVVKLLDTFPKLAESLGSGLHPCPDDAPCCRFAWKATEMFGTNESGVHILIAGNDGQWHEDETVADSN